MVKSNTKMNETLRTKVKQSEQGFGLQKIRKIMKCSESALVTQEGLFLMTKATEVFIQHLAKHASNSSNSLNYEDLANLVQNEDRFEFLTKVVPTKITVKEFKELINKKPEQNSNSSSEDENDDVSSIQIRNKY